MLYYQQSSSEVGSDQATDDATAEQDLSSDPVHNLIANKPKDIIIFLNLVDFLKYVLIKQDFMKYDFIKYDFIKSSVITLANNLLILPTPNPFVISSFCDYSKVWLHFTVMQQHTPFYVGMCLKINSRPSLFLQLRNFWFFRFNVTKLLI